MDKIMHAAFDKKEENNEIYISEVFSQCEKAFVEQISSGFNEQLEQVLQHVQTMTENSASPNEKEACNHLNQIFRANRREMYQDFQHFLSKYFKEKIIVKQTSMTDNSLNLSIMTNEQLENHLAAQDLEKKLSNVLGDELSALAERIEFLLGANSNPFSPDVVARALSSSLQRIFKNNLEHRQALNLFTDGWPQHIKTTYQGINTYLVANDVIPDIVAYRVMKAENATAKNDTYIDPESFNLPPLPSLDDILSYRSNNPDIVEAGFQEDIYIAQTSSPKNNSHANHSPDHMGNSYLHSKGSTTAETMV